MNRFRFSSYCTNCPLRGLCYAAILILVSGCQPNKEPATSKVAQAPHQSPTRTVALASSQLAATVASAKPLAPVEVPAKQSAHETSRAIDRLSSDKLAPVVAAASQDPPLAVSLDEVIKRIDLRTLPVMPGNLQHSATVGTYYLSVTPSKETTVDSVIEYLDGMLLKADCQRSEELESEHFQTTDQRFPMRLYHHGDLLLETSAAQIDGYKGPEITSSIIVYGNLDLRQYTWPKGATITRSKPNYIELKIKGDVLELRKHFSEYFKARQWQEFRDFIPGVPYPMESIIPFQKFIQNGIVISLYYRDEDVKQAQGTFGSGSLVCYVSVSLAELEPVLPGPVSSFKIRFSPLAMVYETPLSPEELQVQLDKLYQSKGFQSQPVDKPTDGSIHLRYKHSSEPALDIEFENAGKTTLVVVNEVKN